MTVIDFPNPFRLTVRRQCRKCTGWVTIDLCNGAEAPREHFFVCSDCGHSEEATEDRVAALTLVQPELGMDGAA